MRKASIVLFEGPDGAGKSHAAELREQRELGRGFATHMIHNGPPVGVTDGKKLYNFYLNQLELAVLRRPSDVSTIIDRSFVSEGIYGPIYRGKSLLTPRQIRKLERYCDKHDITRIGLDTPLWMRLHRIDERGEPFDPYQATVGLRYRKYFQDHTSWFIVSGQLANA